MEKQREMSMTTLAPINHPTATSRFLALKAEIDDLLAALQTASDDHFGAEPDAVNWGHVGVLADLRNNLKAAVERFDDQPEDC